jgi:hypothetical protein
LQKFKKLHNLQKIRNLQKITHFTKITKVNASNYKHDDAKHNQRMILSWSQKRKVILRFNILTRRSLVLSYDCLKGRMNKVKS